MSTVKTNKVLQKQSFHYIQMVRVSNQAKNKLNGRGKNLDDHAYIILVFHSEF